MARHRKSKSVPRFIAGQTLVYGCCSADEEWPTPGRGDCRLLFPGDRDRIIKLHVGTWHAGPHFTHDECLFSNLENEDTNTMDFQDASSAARAPNRGIKAAATCLFWFDFA